MCRGSRNETCALHGMDEKESEGDSEVPDLFRGALCTHRPTHLHAYGIGNVIYYRTLGIAFRILSCAYGQQIAQRT